MNAGIFPQLFRPLIGSQEQFLDSTEVEVELANERVKNERRINQTLIQELIGKSLENLNDNLLAIRPNHRKYLINAGCIQCINRIDCMKFRVIVSIV